MATPEPLNIEGSGTAEPRTDTRRTLDDKNAGTSHFEPSFNTFITSQVTSATMPDDGDPWLPRPLTPYLESIQATSRWRFTLFGGLSGFLCYLCVYFFRKAWQVYEYDTEWLWGASMKDAFLVAQLSGIWLAKIYGWKFNAEVQRSKVTQYLIAAMTFAELTLVLLAILPSDLKPIAMFLSGLPLGLVWGLIVAILEGRESSDAMLVMLACSFVLGSGFAKDAGNAVLNNLNVDPYWMPAVTGLMAYPVFLLATWLLYQIPDPLKSEQQERTKRKAMFSNERGFFFFSQWPGLICLWVAILLVTTVREFRDAYSSQIFEALQVDPDDVVYSRTEMIVAFVVIGTVGLVGLVKDNRRAVQVTFVIMLIGSIFLLATVWLGHEQLGAYPWMTCVGIGLYMSYVAYNSVLFERLIAYTKTSSTVAFPMVISDSVGYAAALVVAIMTLFEIGTTDVIAVINSLGMLCGIVTIVAWCLAAVYYFGAFQQTQETKRGSRHRRKRANTRDKGRRTGGTAASVGFVDDAGAELAATSTAGPAPVAES